VGDAGGGQSKTFGNKPVTNVQGLKGLKVRVQGAPIWSRTFQAAGMAPTVIAYNEVYNAIQNGVIAAGENEAAGVEQMKFYEVAPHLSMTQHAITIRPLCFSGKTFKKLDKNLQAAVLRAGKEAGAYGREIESSEDEAKLVKMEKEGKLKRVPFAGRDEMKKRVDPVMAAYAKEIGAEQILAKINSIK
jgi:TRAP-type C4-dicarboxylate transport system substrate-binding protein